MHRREKHLSARGEHLTVAFKLPLSPIPLHPHWTIHLLVSHRPWRLWAEKVLRRIKEVWEKKNIPTENRSKGKAQKQRVRENTKNSNHLGRVGLVISTRPTRLGLSLHPVQGRARSQTIPSSDDLHKTGDDYGFSPSLFTDLEVKVENMNKPQGQGPD